MGCNKCSGTSQGNTQGRLSGFIQPGGCGPFNMVVPTLDDTGFGNSMSVSGLQHNRLGAETKIQHRDRFGRIKNCGSSRAEPDDDTVNITFAACGCGGFMPSELIECRADIWIGTFCCDSDRASMDNAQNLLHLGGVEFQDDQYSDLSAINFGDDAEITITHSASLDSIERMHPIVMPEVALSAGMDTGTYVTSATFANNERCGNSADCGPERNCGEQWYALTLEGNVIYQASNAAGVAQVAIPGWSGVGLSLQNIMYCNGRLYVTESDGAGATTIYVADVGTNGVPGTFTAQPFAGLSSWRGTICTDDGPIAFGNDVYLLSENGSVSVLHDLPAGVPAFGMDSCLGENLVVGDQGLVYVNAGCDTLGPAGSSPTINRLWAAGIRVAGEFWIGGDDGVMWVSQDGGDTWQLVTNFPPTGGTLRRIKWASPCVGYAMYDTGAVEIYVTRDGGNTWTNQEPTIENVPQTAMINMDIACCGNDTLAVNNFIVGGATAGAGVVHVAEIDSCL